MTSTAASVAVVLAHQGGWDEILMVLVPVAIFAVLLRMANQRARAQNSPTGKSGASGKPGNGKSGKGPRGPM